MVCACNRPPFGLVSTEGKFHQKCPKSVRARFYTAHSSGQPVQVHTESESNKSRKMDRKAPIITRNSIFGLHHCIPNMSDRLLGQTDALDHGRWTKSGAAWAVKSAPLPIILGNNAPSAAARAGRFIELRQNAKIDNHCPSE